MHALASHRLVQSFAALRLCVASAFGTFQFLTAPALAQIPRIPTGATEAAIVAAAETEGSSYVRGPAPARVPRAFTGGERFLATSLTAFGRIAATDPRLATAARTCVDASDAGPIRSGEFVIGGQIGGARALRAGRQGKVWWAPLHQARDMAPLVVRGRNLSAPRDTLIYTQSQIASPPAPGTQRVAADEYFFPSGITIPTAGRWLLIATSGRNWGCFRLTVQ